MKEGQSTKRQLFMRATSRFLKMIALGLLVQGARFPNYNLERLRLMGILQRIAICYYISALITIFVPERKHTLLRSRLDEADVSPFAVRILYHISSC